MKLRSIKRMFSAVFWPSLLIGTAATVAPVYAVTPLAYLQSQTGPAYRPGNTMLRLARCGWPYLGDGTGGQLDLDTQKELAGRWGYVMQCYGNAGEFGYNAFSDPNSVASNILKWCKNNPGYEAHVWECRQVPSFAASPSCYLRRADGSAITDPNGNPLWSPAAPDTELLNFSQQRINALNVGRQYGPITYMGNMGEYAQILLHAYINGVEVDLIPYYSQDPTVMAAKGSTDWFSYVSAAKAHQEIVMHSKVRDGIPELKHYYWYGNGGGFDRNRGGGWVYWTWGYEWMKNITQYPSEQCYFGDSNDGLTGPNDVLTKELNATGWQINQGRPLAYTWVEGPRASYGGAANFERCWIGFLKVLYTLGTLGANVGDYDQTNPVNQPDVDPANPPMWMCGIMDTARVHALFSWIEPFLRGSDLLPGPNMHIYGGYNPAYEFPVANDPNARVVARKMTGANRWLITAWAMDGGNRYVNVTIPGLGTVTLRAQDVGSVYHYVNGSLTQLDSSDGTLVTLDTNTLNAQFGDLYSATSTLQNPGFESPTLSNGSFVYTPSNAGWTFNGGGIQRNGSAFGVANAPEGYQTAFIQGTASISQSINMAAGGYTLNFQAARRSGQVQPIKISVDGAQVGSLITPTSNSFAAYSSTAFTVNAGIHTIMMQGTASGDLSCMIDQVSLIPMLQNSGFESPTLSNGAFVYTPSNAGWTFNGGGIQRNGSAFGVANAPEGYQTAFLQGTAAISQTINLAAGSYTLNFQAARRSGQVQPIKISVDGTQVGSLITPTSNSFAAYSSATFTVTAGTHTIMMQGTASGDLSSMIDQVTVH